jgi:hypothetical protein
MRKNGAVEIRVDLTNNQIIIKGNSGEKKLNISDSGLSSELQQELKSVQEPITLDQVSSEFDQDKNKKNAGIIATILVVGAVIAIVIGVVVHKNRKKDY